MVGIRVRIDPFIQVTLGEHEGHPVMYLGELSGGAPGQNDKAGETILYTIQAAQPCNVIIDGLDGIFVS